VHHFAPFWTSLALFQPLSSFLIYKTCLDFLLLLSLSTFHRCHFLQLKKFFAIFLQITSRELLTYKDIDAYGMRERMCDTFGLQAAHKFFMKNNAVDASDKDGMLKVINLTSEQV
jgi:hypothetical protein